MSGRTIRWVVAGLLAVGLVASIVPPSGGGYQVIEEMEQYINGKQVTVKGRIRWPQNVTIHVYIPNDPEGLGAEQEVQAACKAWEEKLRSETTANLTFEYHVGQSAPPMGPNDPPPYVIEVNWTDTGEPGTATPVSDVTQTGANTYQRGDTYRGIININRNQSPDQPYSSNAIYNIALHEFGHIFGLDHKTPDQDSVIMGDRGIDDPNKKHPIKDDDVRGLQDINGRNPSSTVPPKEGDGDEEDEEPGEPSGTMCCAFE
ncbi:matrixin family metalloprotease, partial [Candidatus Bipolaricaulota bacterium]|nr:matrixin family metalloprotease [Candidatus Bipolaricaulota bacterium]